MLCVPLKARAKVLGVVQVLNSLVNPFFSVEDLNLLSAIAAHAATAIDNALLYEQMAKRNQGLRDVLETSQDFGSILQLNTLLQKIVQKTLEFAPAARSGIILLDEQYRYGYVKSRFQDGRLLGADARLDLRLYPEIRKVIQSRQPLVVVDVLTDPLMVPVRERIAAVGLRSLLVVPLMSKGKVIGVLSVGQCGEIKRFTPEEVNLCQILGNHACVTIENARLYEQVTGQAAELERKVEERTRELQEANTRLEAVSRHKSEFLANMSHELRTPLNSIIGFAELLHEQGFGPLTDKQARHVENILTSGCHLLALINDLLDLAKVEAGRFELRYEAFDARKTLEEALREIQPQAAAKGLSISLATEPDLPSLTADPVRFTQIVLNLLSNAVKFTPDNGFIAVTARMASDAEGTGEPSAPLPRFAVSPIRSESGHLEVRFTDSGIGIRPVDLPKLFQPFTQLEPVFAKHHQGTGLGLALTKRLVELHGGRIWAESDGEGKGSTFTLRLPFVPPGNGHEATDSEEVCSPCVVRG
jgi:signal transduction histidine kinase